MGLEEKKARILEILRLMEESEGDADVWLKTPSPAFAGKSPRAMMDADDEIFIDVMLGVLEHGLAVFR